MTYLFIFISILISIQDLKTRYIEEFHLIILFFISLFKISNIIQSYYSISIFCFPLLIFFIIQSYINKEIIGIGDIKYLLISSIFFSINNIFFVINYYTILYSISLFFSLIFFRKQKYIPFIPFIFITNLIYIIGGVNYQ